MEQTEAVSKDFWLSAVRAEGQAFRRAAAGLDLAAAVPSCPAWTVEDLLAHLGSVYEWVRTVVEAGGRRPDRREPPARGSGVPAYFDEQHAAVLATLEAAAPEAPAWNWSTQPHVAAFWCRRMAHETIVHRWDAQMATGTAEPVQQEWAVDGVSEVLDTLLPAGRGRSTGDAQGVVRLTATDVGRSWLVRLRPEGLMVLDESAVLDDAADAQTGVGGTASDLLLALWGRLAVDALPMEGDPARFAALLVG